MGAPLYPVQYPFINGVRYDYSSISFIANNTRIVGITEISYKQSLEPGEVYGTLAQKIGVTRGQHKAEASFTILQLEYQNMINDLCILNDTPGSGYMETRFDILVQYQDGVGPNQGPLIQDEIRSAKIKSVDHARKAGNEANMVKVELDISFIVENGNMPLQVNGALNQFISGR